jgi:hypothetical protein
MGDEVASSIGGSRRRGRGRRRWRRRWGIRRSLRSVGRFGGRSGSRRRRFGMRCCAEGGAGGIGYGHLRSTGRGCACVRRERGVAHLTTRMSHGPGARQLHARQLGALSRDPPRCRHPVRSVLTGGHGVRALVSSRPLPALLSPRSRARGRVPLLPSGVAGRGARGARPASNHCSTSARGLVRCRWRGCGDRCSGVRRYGGTIVRGRLRSTIVRRLSRGRVASGRRWRRRPPGRGRGREGRRRRRRRRRCSRRERRRSAARLGGRCRRRERRRLSAVMSPRSVAVPPPSPRTQRCAWERCRD